MWYPEIRRWSENTVCRLNKKRFSSNFTEGGQDRQTLEDAWNVVVVTHKDEDINPTANSVNQLLIILKIKTEIQPNYFTKL